MSLVLHGASGAGKSTLTAALVSYGFAYISDETVCLNPQSMEIKPFRKPLTVKPGSQEVLAALRPPDNEVSEGSRNWQIPPERLGGPDLPNAPLSPAAIVFPDFNSEHEMVEIVPVSGARAAFVLGEQSSALWAIEPRPLGAIARLVNAAPAYRVSYSDAFEAAPVIIRELLLNPLSVASSGDVSDRKQRAPTGAIGPRRADNVDWLSLDGEVVLFDGTHLHHLDGPGSAIWQALDGEKKSEGVANQLAEQFGADPTQIFLDVEDLVRVLRAHNLVT